MMRRLSVVLLSAGLLGTTCTPFWHSIVVPIESPSAASAARTDLVAVVDRIARAHRLHLQTTGSPACTPHWSFPSSDSTGAFQMTGWPIVCVDTTRANESIVQLDGGLRRLPPGSHADSLWRALQDGLGPLGGRLQR